MLPRTISVRRLNGWLAEIDALAQHHQCAIDLASIAWVGRYQRGLSPREALEEACPALAQLSLFDYADSVRGLQNLHPHP